MPYFNPQIGETYVHLPERRLVKICGFTKAYVWAQSIESGEHAQAPVTLPKVTFVKYYTKYFPKFEVGEWYHRAGSLARYKCVSEFAFEKNGHEQDFCVLVHFDIHGMPNSSTVQKGIVPKDWEKVEKGADDVGINL